MTRTSAHDTAAAISHLARELKAPRIDNVYSTIANQARSQSWTFEEYLAAVLSVEAAARAESGASLRVKRAGFPAVKTIADFDFTAQPSIDRTEIARLETGA
ncbi:ATP-binding protein, partial [Corynebacterium sanguinis]